MHVIATHKNDTQKITGKNSTSVKNMAQKKDVVHKNNNYSFHFEKVTRVRKE